MKKISILLMLMSIFVPIQGHAGWTKSWGKITQVMSHDGFHVIYTTISDKTCDESGNFWWPKDDPDSDDMYSMALAAFMGGKEVLLVHDEANQECKFGHISKATHMRIR
ncbi:hypothetical protein CWB99_16665 [Pseudoalteromonas rubra]|uniref:Uncharacterized protein n=1 Tax=Pseudoalteromonas rubra TaxID=43658 RepID=A0A5S3WIR1_9GAMM|nr:hypothetical protein [Pseudoalteromonas rubra]TMP26934.1 hypothetical protein CWB99_16665 [Pseudoalteromonas rubra]TMP27652.1 hypothetical protein CWC00_22860 [Pseudoalteromonas rubra]TMP39007.1 hypothetical protein CWB98_04790 [Pseudoalteromonas rubra]